MKELNQLFSRTLKKVNDSFITKFEEMKKLIINNLNEGEKQNYSRKKKINKWNQYKYK